MQAGNAENFYDVFTNMKTEKITQRRTGSFFCPAVATHLKESQVRTHAVPDLKRAGKKIRVARKRGKLLRRWGSVVMGQVGPNVKMNVKSQHPLLMSIGSVLVLFGFEPHPSGF